MTITDIAGCCKALSDENRLSIIKMLSKGEKCACCLFRNTKSYAAYYVSSYECIS